MKNVVFFFITVLFSAFVACAQKSDDTAALVTLENNNATVKDTTDENKTNKMKITIGNTVLTATLVDNSSTEALKKVLSKAPLTIEMQDYGNMEKVGSLGQDFPRNDESITAKAGDIILYQGNALVIYYASNSWSFTRLGKIDNVTQNELKEILGRGNVTVTLSLTKD